MSEFNIEHSGLTFDRFRKALTWIFFGNDEWKEDSPLFREAMKKVIPMQYNIMLPTGNPMVESMYDSDSDIIQFWITSDDRITHNMIRQDLSSVDRVANITVRFLGKNSEMFAKTMGHMHGRTKANAIISLYTNGGLLDYIGPIVPQNIPLFKTGDNFIAYSVEIMIRYMDIMKISKNGVGILKYLSYSDT